MLLVKKKKAEVNFSASSYSLKGIHGTCVHISLAKASPMVKLNVSWVERNIPTMERDRECFNKKYHLFCSLWAYCSCTSLWLWMSILSAVAKRLFGEWPQCGRRWRGTLVAASQTRLAPVSIMSLSIWIVQRYFFELKFRLLFKKLFILCWGYSR